MNLTPELVQLIVALTGFIGVLTGYIKLRKKIEKSAADAQSRENKLKSEALDRENKLKADAEQIQQEAQRIVNEIVTSLRDDISAMKTANDGLQVKHNTLIADHAELLSKHNILEQTTRQALQIWKTKHSDALAKIEQLTETQKKLTESEQARMELLNTVNDLKAQSGLQGARIEALEEHIVSLGKQIELEKQLRERAEEAASDARSLLAAQADNHNNGKADIPVRSPDNAASKSTTSSEKVKHD